jgi:hypothetical protein
MESTKIVPAIEPADQDWRTYENFRVCDEPTNLLLESRADIMGIAAINEVIGFG